MAMANLSNGQVLIQDGCSIVVGAGDSVVGGSSCEFADFGTSLSTVFMGNDGSTLTDTTSPVTLGYTLSELRLVRELLYLGSGDPGFAVNTNGASIYVGTSSTDMT